MTLNSLLVNSFLLGYGIILGLSFSFKSTVYKWVEENFSKSHPIFFKTFQMFCMRPNKSDDLSFFFG